MENFQRRLTMQKRNPIFARLFLTKTASKYFQHFYQTIVLLKQ